MAADIIISGGYNNGGSGQPDDRLFIKGTGWTEDETIAENSITVGGSATQHRVITVNANGKFESEPIYIKITEAITTEGYHDIIVTGSVTGETPFTDYWYVTAGCGINDLFRRGDFSKEMSSGFELESFIDEARLEYNGYLEGWLSTDYFPHTVGNYPTQVVAIIADLAISEFWKGRGAAKEYMERSKIFMERAMKKIKMIKCRRMKLYDPATEVKIPVNASFKRHDAAINNFSNVTAGNSDVTPDDYS